MSQNLTDTRLKNQAKPTEDPADGFDALNVEQARHSPPPSDDPNTAQGHPKHDVAYVKDPKQIWKEGKKPWAASTGARIILRSTVRATLGAIGFALGETMAPTLMEGYNPSLPGKNPYQKLARFFDMTFGKAIAKTFGEKSVQFGFDGDTLGKTVIKGNLGFAWAGCFERTGIEVIRVLDPHDRPTWKDKDGKIIPPELFKYVLAAATRIAMAQAPDFAVAVPYAYQRKWQRIGLNRIFPGFMQDANTGLNGGTYQVNDKGQVIGTFSLAAVGDLQLRFTSYNIETSIFNDGLAWVTRKFRTIKNQDLTDTDRFNKGHTHNMYDAGHGWLYKSTRYLLKKVIIGTIYMTPAVPLFSIIRTGQYKVKEHGIVFKPDANGKMRPVENGQVMVDGAMRTKYQTVLNSGNGNALNLNVPQGGVRNRYDFSQYNLQEYNGHLGIDKFVNRFATVSASLNQQGTKLMPGFATNRQRPELIQKFADKYPLTNIGGAATDAFAAYTLYTVGKNELHDRINTPLMNTATQNFLDGGLTGNWIKMRDGFKEMGFAIRQKQSDVHTTYLETIPEGYIPDRGIVIRKKKNAPVDDKKNLEGQMGKVMAEQGRINGQSPNTGIWEQMDEKSTHGRKPTNEEQPDEWTVRKTAADEARSRFALGA